MPHTLHVHVTENGYVPAVSVVPRGHPLVAIFTRKVPETCGSDVVFPSLHRGYDLPLGRPVTVRLTADEVGDSLAFNCSTDLIRGAFVAR